MPAYRVISITTSSLETGAHDQQRVRAFKHPAAGGKTAVGALVHLVEGVVDGKPAAALLLQRVQQQAGSLFV